MDPVHSLYMRLRALESKAMMCDMEAKDAPEDVKAAYATIKAYHTSTIAALKTEVANAVSAALNTPAK